MSGFSKLVHDIGHKLSHSQDEDKANDSTEPIATSSNIHQSTPTERTAQCTEPDISAKADAEARYKWGTTSSSSDEPAVKHFKPDSAYSMEQQAARAEQRRKGVNPDLKAEMDYRLYGKGEEPYPGCPKGNAKTGLMTKFAVGGGAGVLGPTV